MYTLIARTNGITMDELVADARACDFNIAAPKPIGFAPTTDHDLIGWGDEANAKRFIAVIGLGLDEERRGMVQGIFDENGQRWGRIVYAVGGRVSIRLSYFLKPTKS